LVTTVGSREPKKQVVRELRTEKQRVGKEEGVEGGGKEGGAEKGTRDKGKIASNRK